MITQCCECRKVREGKRWTKKPEPMTKAERVSHGYCPACARKAFQEIEAYYDSLPAPGAAV